MADLGKSRMLLRRYSFWIFTVIFFSEDSISITSRQNPPTVSAADTSKARPLSKRQTVKHPKQPLQIASNDCNGCYGSFRLPFTKPENWLQYGQSQSAPARVGCGSACAAAWNHTLTAVHAIPLPRHFLHLQLYLFCGEILRVAALAGITFR